MNINRHNYEEFFLLYVDNELSAAEKKAVDVFVQENPDLQVELLSLQQTVIKAEDIVLEKKDWLMMEERIPVLQENLLLYADGELPAADKKAVEALLATDRTARAEWQILQQTILQPDASVVFKDKQSLYRKEGSRVVVIKWWRVAAAAVLLGFGLWTGVSVYKNNFKTTAGEEGIASKSNKKPGHGKDETTTNAIAGENQSKNIVTPGNQNATVAEAPVIIKEQAIENADQPGKKIIQKNTARQEDAVTVQNNNKKPSNNLPKSYLENINNKGSNEMVRTHVLPEKDNSITGSGTNEAIVKARPKEKITSPDVVDLHKNNPDPTTTAAVAVGYTGDNNDHYLDTDDENAKRTKLGGFLRKAKRVLERTANIKTGEGLQVAGFEIAVK